jgi:glucosamine-6-phosphate deaminase
MSRHRIIHIYIPSLAHSKFFLNDYKRIKIGQPLKWTSFVKNYIESWPALPSKAIKMKIIVSNDQKQLGHRAGRAAAALILKAIGERGEANIILATGSSQFETLDYLVKEQIDWTRVSMFHLDEYIGLPESSPSSFRRYLKERFLDKVSPLKAVHLINGNSNPWLECKRLNEMIRQVVIDVALVGIGENCHLAFNDPPADFDTNDPFIIVTLDSRCRQQQFNEGWFNSIEQVPKQAISMSIKQIFSSSHILCSVPEARKAQAVKNCVEQKASNLFPASILQLHQDCTLFLDTASASLINQDFVKMQSA